MSAELNTSSFKLGTLGASLGQLDRAQWLALARRHAPQVVSGAAIVGIAWQLATVTWVVWGLFQKDTPAPAYSSAPVMNVASNASVDPQAIANAHLFGMPGATSGNADPNALPKAQVNLVLAGTMALQDPQAGFAIIGDNAINAKFYRVGAIMNGVARLHSVYVDRVVIDRNGSLETLTLPRGPSMAMTMAPAPRAPNLVASENVRRLANATPDTISNLLRSQPVFVNGALKGFRVYPGRDRTQFVKAGLQPGDLVTAINGTLLDDPSRGGEIINTLSSSSTAQLSIERNGSMQQITLDMTQLSIPDGSSDASQSSSAAARGNFMAPAPPAGSRPPRADDSALNNSGGTPAGAH